jgi:hypothetical protein
MDAGMIAVSPHAFKLSYPALTASIQEFGMPANLFAMSDHRYIPCLPSHSMIFFRFLNTERNNHRRHALSPHIDYETTIQVTVTLGLYSCAAFSNAHVQRVVGLFIGIELHVCRPTR